MSGPSLSLYCEGQSVRLEGSLAISAVGGVLNLRLTLELVIYKYGNNKCSYGVSLDITEKTKRNGIK